MKRLLVVATGTLLSFVICIGLIAAMLLTSRSAYAGPLGDGNVNQTLNATSNATVRVNNIAGSVTVRGWGNNQVQVTGTVRGGVRLDLHGSAGDIEVRAVYPQISQNDASAELIIQVPAASRLSVGTVSANIQVSGLNGSAQLNSISGDVRLDSHADNISGRSVSGDVTISGSAKGAHVSGHSISGDVRISGVDGDVDAGSVSGSVQVNASRLDRAKLGSTSGNLSFAAGLAKSGSYDFNSTSGNLTLSFPQTPDARFDLSSFSGDIDNNFGPKAQRTSEYGPGRELHFTSGAGSAQVTAHTLSGNITLHAS